MIVVVEPRLEVVSYVEEEMLKVEIEVAKEETVADPRTVDTIVLDDGVKDEVRVTTAKDELGT